MESAARRSFHLGRYHCTETISHGPLGETFRAKVYGVAGLEKQYALKQIDAGLRVDPELRARLVEAARRYSTLEHERIARLTEIHDEADTLFLVSELSRGIDLPRLVTHLRGRGETLPIEQAILIAADIAEALDVAHRATERAPNGVLHLGLSPSAVSVLGEGEVRVSDFALAEALVRPGWTEDDANAQLLAYTAPERVRGGVATAASDVWSVGALLFELCAGVPLILGTTAETIAASRPMAQWEKLPARAGLQELLQRFVSDEPTTRPQNGASARESLVGLLGLEITRARAGLQALVKRALGRTLTRTGSFAAVAIPSTSMPALNEPAATAPDASGPRSILGAMPLVKAAVAPSEPEAKPRGWTPPSKTSALPVVKADPPASPHIPKIQTLPGLGAASPDGEPPQMEMAELPPTAEVTVTERTMEAIAFDDVVTNPHSRIQAEQIDALDEPILLDAEDVHESPTRHGMPPLPAAAFPSREMPVVPPPDEPTIPPLTPEGVRPTEAMPGPSDSQPTLVAATSSDSQPTLVAAPASEAPPIEVAAPVEAPPAPAPVVAPSPAPAITELKTQPPRTSPLALPPPPASSSPSMPAAQRQRRNGIWIAAGAAALAIAVGGLIAAEHGGWSSGPTVEPKVEAPKIEEAPKVEAPKVEETPKVEAPKVEAPKVEAPKVEAPKVEAPKVEAPKVEAPKVEAPKVEAPKVEAPVAIAGQLSIVTTPPGATIWIDGESRGESPLNWPAPAGAHRVIAALQGHKLLQKSVTAEAGGTSLALTLEPAKLPPELVGEGGLKVRCRTLNELRILVDGHDSGLSCPNDVRINVTPGDHKIGLQSPRTGEIKEIDGTVEDDVDHSTRIYVRY